MKVSKAGNYISHTHNHFQQISQWTMVPEYSEQGTSVALPTARPTPLFPKKAADAPESLHKSKLTFAPY